ncbi:MAG: RIP metalloprotease RseP [Proteobacteria bacterium]|nr:RIP metalloprotease RseP [Pseudomonadota bacterium]
MLENMMNFQVLNSVVMFVVVLGILVFVHEFGHYLAAKTVNMKVRSFSIGFGKEIFGFTRQNGERWKISLIPLGGYVDLYGMDGNEDYIKEEKDPKVLKKAFFNKNVFARMWVVFAGPFSNILFAIFSLTILFSAVGVKELSTTIGEVKEGFPAAKAGMMSGDKILAISGSEVSKWSEMAEKITATNPNETITIKVKRNDEIIELTLPTESMELENVYKEKKERRVIGVTASTEYLDTRKVSVFDAIKESVEYTAEFSGVILGTVKRIITGTMKADLGGPLTIAEQSGKAAESGIYTLVLFLVHLSINLAILNLLPIPVLDGGHLVYGLIEILSFGRGLHDKIKFVANYIGLALLLLLMVFVFYKDIDRIFLKDSPDEIKVEEVKTK